MFVLNKIIQSLIENAHSIYDLYRKIKDTEDRQEKETFFNCLEYLVSKEEQYLEKLKNEYRAYLNSIYYQFLIQCGFNNESLIDNYIVLNNQSLILLRILERLKILYRENPTINYSANADGELMVMDKESNKFYFSEEDFIIDNIKDDLENELCIRFMNISQKQKPKQQNLIEKIKSIPYEITYLSPRLEQIFLRDRILNTSYQLFQTNIAYENAFDTYMLNATISNTCYNLAYIQTKLLTLKRQTRTDQIAFLRSIYIATLLENVNEETKENYFETLHDEIKRIPYNFALVRKLKKEAKNLSVIEVEIPQTIEE